MEVDFVVPWVDGDDILWINEKNKYSPHKIGDQNSNSRFQDLGFMKYWFRAIEKYTPWFNKIYFITWGHLPDFLVQDHPKLRIIRHEDYIPKQWLPTFSSHTIEMNLHRIKELSDNFVYFNDDTFITKPLKKEFFFCNDKPCCYVAEVPLGFIGKPETWAFAAANDLGIINAHFNKKSQERKYNDLYLNMKYSFYDNIRTLLLSLMFPNYYTGFKNFHCPAALTKKTFVELWNKEKDILELTSSHRFRDKEDVNQWVIQWWQIASGNAYPRSTKAVKYNVTADNANKVVDAIISKSYDMLCISSPDINSVEAANGEYLLKVRKAFEQMLPEKSTFER